jgi:uncharacterized protein (AIM24 family)
MNGTVIYRMEGEQSTVEVIEYASLNISRRPDLAAIAFYAQQMGLRLRQLRITLNGGGAVIEPGMLQFSRGTISTNTAVGGAWGLIKRFIQRRFNNESIFRTTFQGQGEIYTEPTFDHYILTRIQAGEEAVVDDGRYVASEVGVETGIALKKNVSTLLFSRDEIARTQITGSGWVVVQSPIPASDILRIDLNEEELRVDGEIVVFRKGAITQRIDNATTNPLGLATSGEGLVQVFRGSGQVWLAPAENGYAQLIELLQEAGMPYKAGKTHQPRRTSLLEELIK